MALKADAQGFLAGEPIDIGTTLGLWRNIGADVRAIRQSLAGNIGRTPVVDHRAASLSEPLQRYEAARAPQRDQRGRFVSPGNSHSQVRPSSIPSSASKAERPIALAPSAVSVRPSSHSLSMPFSTAGMDGVDPAVAAFNEIAQPLARGWEMVGSRGGDDKKQVGLLRRIFGVLNSGQKEDGAFQKAAKRSLGVIEGNTEPKAGNGGSGLSGLFGGVKNMLSGGGILGSLAGAGKGFLKRIPLLGSLLSLGGAALSIFDSENDDTKTRREKDVAFGGAAGGAAGSIGGMLAGAKLGAAIGALGGPIGAAIGGVVGGAAGMFFGDQAGQIIGEQIGSWVNDLRAYDIPGKIVAAWDIATNAIKGFAESAMEKLKGAWDKTKEVANNANDAVKEKTGIDVKEGAKSAWKATKEAAASSDKDAQAVIGFIMLPVIWPAVLSIYLLEKLWGKYCRGPRPENMIGLFSWIFCGVFWWLVAPLFK